MTKANATRWTAEKIALADNFANVQGLMEDLLESGKDVSLVIEGYNINLIVDGKPEYYTITGLSGVLTRLRELNAELQRYFESIGGRP